MGADSTSNILVLVNPISGQGQGREAAERLGPIFHRLDCRAEVRLLEGPGTADRLLEQSQIKPDLVVAVGGDGTVNEVARALYHAGSPCPLGVIPLGLSNCLALHWNLPSDLESAAMVVARGRRVPLDLGVVDGRVCLAFLGAGLDAAIVQKVVAGRTGPINNWTYARAGVSVLFGRKMSGLEVMVDGRKVEGAYFQVILSAISNYAKYFPLDRAPGFRAYLFRGAGWTSLMRTAWRMGVGLDLIKAADVIVPVRKRVEVASASGKAWYQIDGEAGGELPLTCDIMPAGLEFMAPA